MKYADLFKQNKNTILFLFCLSVLAYSIWYIYDENNFQVTTVPFHIPKKDTEASKTVNSVPLVIYQTWNSRTLPTNMKDSIDRLVAKNPEFEYYLYDDADCLEFIKQNFEKEVVNAFESLIPGAYKADLWRYCVLFKNGGVYLDIKYYSLVPLVEVIKQFNTIYVRDGRDGQSLCANALYNGFMVSPPGNKVFRACIDDIVESYRFRLLRSNTLDVTGPCLLGRIVEKEDSKNHIDTIPFHFCTSFGPGIKLNTMTILKHYPKYRRDQRKFQKTPYYADLWKKKQVWKV